MTSTIAIKHKILGILVLAASAVSAAPPGAPSPVTVAEVTASSLREVVPLSASAEALQESEISPRVDGIVAELFVNEGDRVAVGQKLLSLDAVIAEIEVATAVARVDEAVARHKDAIRRKKEFQSLSSRKAVAATSLESAVADEEAASAALVRERTELTRLTELLSRHTLTAPFSGVIAEKLADAGQWVKADSAVVKIVALDRIRIRASLPQRYFRQVDTDADARIVFDALPDETFYGRPSALVAVGNQSTRSFPLLIDLDNPQRRIAPGMSARIFVELADREQQALVVPRDAIVLKADGKRIVWRVNDADGELKVTPVELTAGRPQGDQIEVLDSTLTSGDRVVLFGNENLRAGQTVRLSRVE